MYKILIRGLIIGCFAAIIAWSLSYFQILGGIENRSYDLRQYLTLDDKMEDIIIVGIDDSSLAKLGRWPWERGILARAMKNLIAAHPRVVGIDVLFTESSLDPSQDEALAEAINGNAVVLAGYISAKNIGLDGVKPSYLKPLDLFMNSNGHINVYPDYDGILRKAITDITLPEGSIPSFDLQVLKQGNLQVPTLKSGLSNGELLIKYSKEPNTIPRISFWEIYSNKFKPEDIAGKIVLVGSTAVGIQDQYYTPAGGPMYGVEFHAQAINAMINNRLMTRLASAGAVTVVFGILSGVGFAFLGWLTGLLLAALLTVAYLAFTVYQYDLFLTIWEVAYPLSALYAAYLFNVGYKIWEAQREKNKTFRLFSRYVSYEVAKKLSQGGKVLELGGMRKEITVLFLDVRGFTSIAEIKSPEEVVSILNSLFKIVNKAVFDYGGTLDKYIGDAAMAVFNAPQDVSGHELQAVKAAMAIQRKISESTEEYKNVFGVEIGVGIGINTGEAVVGNIGTKERMDYTAIGDVVNIAARLESKAEKGEILIGPATKEKLSAISDVNLKGLISLEGKSEPIEVYRVEWRWGDGVK